MKNNKKYFYSKEEDKVIVDFVNNDFIQKREERRNFELIWELNMNFYIGNQYSYIMPSGTISDSEKNYTWENREVYNHIAPIIESRLAKLNKIKPFIDVKPNTSTDSDIYKSKLAKAIISSSFSENNITSLINYATHWSEITGTSFYKISWENNIIPSNEITGKNGGDVKISVCTPFEIYPDSNFTEDINNCSSIIETRAFPAAEINAEWGVNLTGEDLDIFELNNNSSYSGLSGRSNYTKVLHSKKHDYLLLIERYEKPTRRHPNGRLTIVCKDHLLYDGDLPYINSINGTRTYPFIKQVSIKQLSCFWGSSIIERCIPIQRAYNALKNRKHEFLSRLTSGVLTVEDGSVDVDNLEINGLEPGKIIVYRNGSTPPKFLDPGTIPEDYEKEESKLLTELNTLSCISEVSTNTSLPSGINSGTAISLLVEEDKSRLSFTAEYITSCLKQIAMNTLRLYKQFATTIRLNKLTDKNGLLEMFYWKNNDISTSDIIIDCENELDNTNTAKKEMIIKLLEKKVFYDEHGYIPMSTQQKILTELGFSDWISFDDLNELHKKRADKENLEIIEEDPSEIDNHQIHIDEHTKYLISDESKNITDDQRQKLIQHIKQHKNKLLEGI